MRGLKTLSSLVLGASLALTPACKNKDRCDVGEPEKVTKCDSGSDEIRKHCRKLRAEARAKAYAACLTNKHGKKHTCKPAVEGDDQINCGFYPHSR